MSIVLFFTVGIMLYLLLQNTDNAVISQKKLTNNSLYNPYLANQYSELADTIALRNTPFPIYQETAAHVDGFKGLPVEAIKYYSKYHPLALSYDIDTRHTGALINK